MSYDCSRLARDLGSTHVTQCADWSQGQEEDQKEVKFPACVSQHWGLVCNTMEKCSVWYFSPTQSQVHQLQIVLYKSVTHSHWYISDTQSYINQWHAVFYIIVTHILWYISNTLSLICINDTHTLTYQLHKVSDISVQHRLLYISEMQSLV